MSRTPRTPRVERERPQRAGRPERPLSADSVLAAEVKALVAAGERDRARERFADLVASQQRRAVRLAFHYLRDADDADEAVQDAFVKVFTHITSYREELPFEVWFTRILVNGCLDYRKSRARRLRWVMQGGHENASYGYSSSDMPSRDAPDHQPSAESRLVSRERMKEIAAAVDGLPDRQRTVFMLHHFGEQTTSQVSQTLGLSEATVRVHLFRAVHKLRRLLER